MNKREELLFYLKRLSQIYKGNPAMLYSDIIAYGLRVLEDNTIITKASDDRLNEFTEVAFYLFSMIGTDRQEENRKIENFQFTNEQFSRFIEQQMKEIRRKFYE